MAAKSLRFASRAMGDLPLTRALRGGVVPGLNTGPLIVDNVGVRFGDRQALTSVSIELRAGEVTALLGPNGAGKSTLIHVLSSLIAPTTGAVYLAKGGAISKAALGLVSQDVRLYPTLTVAENLIFFAQLHSRRLSDHTAIAAIRDQLGLEGLWARCVSKLSGGQARLVHIAASLVHDPSILILDEATAALDEEARERVANLVRSFAQAGRIVMYATHHLDEIEAVADRVVVLAEGRVVADQRYNEFISNSSCSLIEIETNLSLDEHLACRAGEHPGRYVIESGDSARELPSIIAKILAMQGQVMAVRVREPDLKTAIARLLARGSFDEE